MSLSGLLNFQLCWRLDCYLLKTAMMQGLQSCLTVRSIARALVPSTHRSSKFQLEHCDSLISHKARTTHTVSSSQCAAYTDQTACRADATSSVTAVLSKLTFGRAMRRKRSDCRDMEVPRFIHAGRFFRYLISMRYSFVCKQHSQITIKHMFHVHNHAHSGRKGRQSVV